MSQRRVVRGLMLRIAGGLLTIMGVTLATFLVVTVLPGDPLTAFTAAERQGQLSAEQVAALRDEHGLDLPVIVRYGHWLAGVCQGDFGRSLRTHHPVSHEIRRRLLPTIELSLAALLLVTATGLPLGWWLARRAGTRRDTTTSMLLLVLYALPAFWVAIILQNLFAVRWGILPLYGRTPPDGSHTFLGRWDHLLMPAICLALHQLAFYTRFARNTTLVGLRSLHALFARACGLSEGRVMLRHGVRPSLAPLATLVGLIIPSLVTGSVLIETVFSWPGLGRLFFQAVTSRDLPVVLGMTVMMATLTVGGSLLADLAMRLLDPVQRHDHRARG